MTSKRWMPPPDLCIDLIAQNAEIVALVRQAVAAEREACAAFLESQKVDDNQGSKENYWHNRNLSNWAAQIRARE